MRKLMDRDFLAAMVLFFIGFVSLAKAGDDVMDWAFPLLATYFILFAATVLVVRAIYAALTERATDILSFSAEDRTVSRDVLTFLLIALVFLLVMYGLGFWLSSFLMLSLASIYMTQNRTRYNVALAVVVPFASCIVAYVVFQHVFYVPLPAAHWWPLGS